MRLVWTKLLTAFGVMGITAGCSNQTLVPLEQAGLLIKPMMVTVKIKNYCPNRLIDFFAKPLSYEISDGQLLQDSNRDGLTDVEALKFNLSPYHAPVSGISDFIGIEYLGLSVAALSSIPTCLNPTQATSGDILTDCQKNALNLVPVFQYDPIGRGFPDSLAVLARIPLLNKSIAMQDLAGDGWSTLEKIKANLRPDQTVTPAAEALAVNYEIGSKVNPDNSNALCYDFHVTMPRAGISNGDLYEFYFIAADTSGTNVLTTKPLVVQPTVPDGATLELEYATF